MNTRRYRRHIGLIFIPQVPINSAIFVMSLITSKSVCPRAITGSRPVDQSRKPSSGCPVIEYQNSGHLRGYILCPIPRHFHTHPLDLILPSTHPPLSSLNQQTHKQLPASYHIIKPPYSGEPVVQTTKTNYGRRVINRPPRGQRLRLLELLSFWIMPRTSSIIPEH